MARFILTLLYVLIGVLSAVALYRIYPELGPFSAYLLGIIFTLALVGFHVLLSLKSKVQEQEIKILNLRRDLADASSKADGVLRDLSTGHGDPRYEALAGEVRIMQSVMDRIIHGGKPDAATEEGAAVQARLNDREIMNLLSDAVRADRIEVFLQPIVSLPQRKLRFYEMFTRIRTPDGQLVTPERYVKLASDAGILSGIDNLQLLRSVQMIRDADRYSSNLRFFCNISSATLRDTGFMTELVQFLGQHSVLAPKLIFELSQQDLASMSADLVPVLDGLGRLGCRFSMDGVYSLDFPMAALSARKIRTVKIDGDMLLTEYQRLGGRERLQRMKDQLDQTGIDLIVSKIETETQLRDLLDLNIDYGQGFLFGEPRANWPVS